MTWYNQCEQKLGYLKTSGLFDNKITHPENKANYFKENSASEYC